MALVEVPGRRTGPATYAHGWPWPYIARDYGTDQTISFYIYDYEILDPSALESARVIDDDPDQTVPDLATARATTSYSDSGWPWSVEQKLNPWAWDHLSERHWSLAVLDVAVWILVVFVVAWIYQRHQISGDLVTDQTLRQLEVFSQLRSLTLWNTRVTTAGWKSLSRLPRLAALEVDYFPTTDADLEQLASIESLTALGIPAKTITGAGVGHLCRLPNLRFLRLDNLSDDTVVDRLSDLPALERLTLRNPEIDHLNLTGSRTLRKFGTECSNRAFGHLVIDSCGEPWTLLRLASLPALESIRIVSVGVSDVQFADLPELRDVEFGDGTLPSSIVSQLHRLPNLESLGIGSVTLSGTDRLDIQGLGRLHQLKIDDTKLSAIRLDALPEVTRLVIKDNPRISLVDHGPLPKLQRLELSGSPGLVAFDLRGFPQLQELQIPNDASPHGDRQLDGAPRPRPRKLLGLGALSQLEELNLRSMLLDPAQIAEIGGLKRLKKLVAADTWLASADVSRLRTLTNLEELDLTDTDINAELVADLGNLPKLTGLSLDATSVSDAVVQSLQQRRPQLSLDRSSKSATTKQTALADLQQGIEQVRSGSSEIHLDAPELLGDGDFQGLANVANLLVALNLNRTHLTDLGLEPLRQLHALESLELSQTRVSDEGLKQLATLPALRKLNLASTLITGVGLHALEKLANLRALDLSGAEVSDESLAQIRLFPHLEQLSLGNTRITDAGLVHLASLTELRMLDLRATHVTDAGLQHLRNLSRLETLGLAGCSIKGPGLDSLQALRHLTALDLSFMPSVSDPCLEHVGKLRQLKSLRLGDGPFASIENGRELSEVGQHNLAALSNLRELSIPFFSRGPDDLATTLPKVTIETPTDDDQELQKEFQIFGRPAP